jgi:hypothetical protein
MLETDTGRKLAAETDAEAYAAVDAEPIPKIKMTLKMPQPLL